MLPVGVERGGWLFWFVEGLMETWGLVEDAMNFTNLVERFSNPTL
jgi:hypothetical protein